MISSVELTPAVVGLGDLHESGLLALAADMHYRVLTHGKTITPREIVNKTGDALYPSVCALHVRVPPSRTLARHELWQRFDLGVDVRAFGRQFLDTTVVLGRPGEVPERADEWGELVLPRVTWSSAWTLTRSNGDHELSMAPADVISALPRLAKVPAGIAAARDVFARGRLWASARGERAVRYAVVAGRDAAIGRQMMFSHFLVVLDVVERTFLGERIEQPIPSHALDAMAVQERRVFYFGNCGAGDVIEAYVTATLASGTPLVVRTEIELIDATTGRLLALADTHKTLSIPFEEAEQMLSQHGTDKPLVEARS